MNNQITMGNDEFILYIRKNYNCSLTNDRIGRLVWKWIRENSKEVSSKKDVVHRLPCLWQTNRKIKKTYGIRLPMTAAQFTFNRKLLPKLYTYLDKIALTHPAQESWEELMRKNQSDNSNLPEFKF